MKKMRLAKRKIRDKEVLKEILEQCQVLRIGTMDKDGMFIVPVNYGYEWKEGEPLRFYIHSAKEGRKSEAFAQNTQVALELDCPMGVIEGTYTCSYSYAYRSIMGEGKIRLLTDTEEKKRGLAKLMEHMEPKASLKFLTQMLDAAAVYCIEVLTFTGKERSPKITNRKQEEEHDHS